MTFFIHTKRDLQYFKTAIPQNHYFIADTINLECLNEKLIFEVANTFANNLFNLGEEEYDKAQSSNKNFHLLGNNYINKEEEETNKFIENLIMNPASFDQQQQQPKTANSEIVDYRDLFRGLSSFVPSISIDLKESANGCGEKTYADLTDALIIAQNQSNSAIQMFLPMPTEIVSQQQQQQPQHQMMLSQLMVHNKLPSELTKIEGSDETDPESSTNSRSSTSSAMSFGNSSTSVSPVTTRGRPQKIKPMKRLSTTSTTSSISVPIVATSTKVTTDVPRVTQRGRKPSGMGGASVASVAPTRPNGKKTKKQQMLEDAQKNQKPVVCFGNKVVPKETDEYFKRRENNNEAVKKCREKLTQKQHEREERMKLLDDENKKLTGTVESLNKELNVLKNIIIQMNPQQKLPDYITNLFKQLDEES